MSVKARGLVRREAIVMLKTGKRHVTPCATWWQRSCALNRTRAVSGRMSTDSIAKAPATADLDPSDELYEAINEGDPQPIRALIEAGANINYKCEYGALIMQSIVKMTPDCSNSWPCFLPRAWTSQVSVTTLSPGCVSSRGLASSTRSSSFSTAAQIAAISNGPGCTRLSPSGRSPMSRRLLTRANRSRRGIGGRAHHG